MGKINIFAVVALVLIWILLVEEFSWQAAIVGLIVGALCLFFAYKFLNLKKIKDVNFFKLATYPFWLISRIYMNAIYMIKMIFTNAKWGIATTETKLKSESLRIIQADSITLTPGSILIELDDDQITLLCMGDRKLPGYPAVFEDLGKIEKKLLKAQKK